MKKILNAIKYIIILILIAAVVLLGTNKTFIYDHYKVEPMMGDGIPIHRFMYYTEGSNNSIKFITPISITGLNNSKGEYLGGLKNCYGKYYYDEDNRITITDYEITEDNHYNRVKISYVTDNLCSEDYVLSDMWVYEYNAYTTFVSGDITEKAMIKLLETVYNAKRVESPIITNYKSEVKINVDCHMQKYDYKLVFEDYSANEIKVTKKYEGKEQFAVYSVDNAKGYLNSLDKSE